MEDYVHLPLSKQKLQSATHCTWHAVTYISLYINKWHERKHVSTVLLPYCPSLYTHTLMNTQLLALISVSEYWDFTHHRPILRVCPGAGAGFTEAAFATTKPMGARAGASAAGLV